MPAPSPDGQPAWPAPLGVTTVCPQRPVWGSISRQGRTPSFPFRLVAAAAGEGVAPHGLTNLRLTLETPFSGRPVPEALPRDGRQSPQQAGVLWELLDQCPGWAPGLHPTHLFPYQALRLCPGCSSVFSAPLNCSPKWLPHPSPNPQGVARVPQGWAHPPLEGHA